MKRFLLLLLLFPIYLQAQFSKGDATIGGAIDLFYQPTQDFFQGDLFNASISPSYGRFVSDRLLVGGSVNTQVFDSGFTKFSSLSIQPYARYYFKPQKANNFLYGELGGNLGQVISSSQALTIDLRATVGLDHFVAPGVSTNFVASVIHGFTFEQTNALFQGRLTAYLQDTEIEEAPITSQVLRAGNLIIGGSNFSFARELGGVAWSLNVSPGLGYFVTDHWVAGADITLNHNVSKTNSIPFPGTLSPDDIIIFNNFTVQAYTRYYFLESARLAPYAAASYNYSRSNSGFRRNLLTDSSNSINLGIGADYFLSKHIALEGNLFFDKNLASENYEISCQVAVQFFFLR